MEKNNKDISLSQALKLYNGRSIPKMILVISVLMLIMYTATILFFIVMLSLEGGFDEAKKEVFSGIMCAAYLAIDGGITTAILSILTYDKKFPGGKFFRSVKGGFDTYRKMKTGLLIATICGVCLYIAVICAVNAVYPIMEYGTAICISFLIFFILGMSMVNFVSMIRNDLARSVLNVTVYFISGVAGVFTVFTLNGKLNAVHFAAAVIAAVLLPVSHRIMLASYRKKRWDN